MSTSSRDIQTIQIIWCIGLLGALMATLAVLKEVALVLRALQDIHQLARMTREAAEGIARNVEPIGGLDAIAGPAARLDEHTQALASTAAAIERKLGSLAPAPRGT
jgi:hypothetical protein